MKMAYFQKTTALTLLCLLLAACGGAGTGSGTGTLGMTPVTPPVDPDPPVDPVPPVEPDPVPPVVVSQSLTDTSLTDPLDVALLSASGEIAAAFDTQTDSLSVNGVTYQAAGDGLNTGLVYVRVLETGNVAILETTGTVPSGSATYDGKAIVRLTDSTNSTVYDGTANITIYADIGAGGATSMSYSNFNGTRRVGVDAPTNFTSGDIDVDNVVASSSGLSGGVVSGAWGFGDADFSDNQSTQLNGLFGGPEAAEVGGTLTSTADGGALQSTFAAAK